MSTRKDGDVNKKVITLYHGMLFRARRMFKGYVCNRAVTTYEVRTLAMYMEQIYTTPTNASCMCVSGREEGTHAPTCSSPLKT